MRLPPLRRLWTMDREELRYRVATTVRREASRLRCAVRQPRWDRGDLLKQLRPDSPAFRLAGEELGQGRWDGAHRALAHHFATREPGFVLDPRRRASMVLAIQTDFTNATTAAAVRADRIVEGRFDLLGYGDLRFASAKNPAGIDWELDPVHGRRAPRRFWTRVPYLEASTGDHKIVWELNRHQYWTALGRADWLTENPRYRRCFVEHFVSWMAANPPLMGTNWASMLELSLRSLSWLWALHFFAADAGPHTHEPPWTVDLLLGLDRQMTLVQQNLSWYFSPNTHLLGEALGLYVAGRALPELRNAAGWERDGRAILLSEIGRQIHEDGGHAELSAHYHRYTLDFYLLALATARRTGDPAAEAFADAARRLARFARTLADDNGRLPTIGDDDGGSLLPICGREPADASDSLQLAAVLLDQPELAVGAPAEEVVWVTGQTPKPQASAPWSSAALPDTGYAVCRTRRGDHLIVDAGPHGFMNGGHAHADALSMTLTVRGVPFLIDPGTGCYTVDSAVRDRFRSTPLHNTVTLDGRSQSIPDGPFHWRTRARATAVEWRTAARFDYFEASHDGYAPDLHERAVLARSGCWVVRDSLRGAGVHRADAHWHLDPGWTAVKTRRGVVRAEHPQPLTLWMLSLDHDLEIVRGDEGSALGWCAPVYGPLVPTRTIQLAHTAPLPFELVTVIVDSEEEPRIERLPIEGDRQADGHAGGVAFSVQTASWRDTIFFRGWRSAAEPERQAARIGPLETDARILCWREDSQHPDGWADVLVDATFVRRRTGAPAHREMASAGIRLD